MILGCMCSGLMFGGRV